MAGQAQLVQVDVSQGLAGLERRSASRPSGEPRRRFHEDVASLGGALQERAWRRSWDQQKTEAYAQARERYEAEQRARQQERRQQEGSQGAT